MPTAAIERLSGRGHPAPRLGYRIPHAGLALALLLTAACAGTDVMDAHCTPSSPDIEADEDCPFQAGQGPQVKEGVCPPLSAEATQDVTWTDVFDIFKANESGNCSSPLVTA